MRAFVRLRQLLASNAKLAHKLAALEKKYDAQFKVVFDAIRELMAPLEPKRRRIEFQVKEQTGRGMGWDCRPGNPLAPVPGGEGQVRGSPGRE